jgi:DnaJ-class molecular chaperone
MRLLRKWQSILLGRDMESNSSRKQRSSICSHCGGTGLTVLHSPEGIATCGLCNGSGVNIENVLPPIAKETKMKLINGVWIKHE